MGFHALPRRDLQTLCKRNGVRANMTNAAMADALAKLPTVDGIDEFLKQPVALPAPATKSEVKAVPEEDPREKKGSPLPRGRRVTVSSPEVIKLDDSDKEAPGENKGAPLPRGRCGTVRSSKFIRPDDGEEEGKEDENRDDNAHAHGEGLRGASRRARAAPVVAPTTRRRAAPGSKIETGDVTAEAPPVPTTRRRAQTSTEVALAPTTRQGAQSTVAAPAEEKVPQGRRTTRRAAARKPDIQQQEEEECLQGVVPVVESTETAPVSDAGCDDTDEVEETREPLAAEQNSAPEEPVQEEEETEVEVPKETVEAVVQECSPDAVVEDKPVQEDEGIEVESPAETVEAVAQECSPDAGMLRNAQVDVEQPISQDDSPILGLVSGAAVGESEEAPVCNSECPMDMLVTEEKEAMPADEVSKAMVTCSQATGDAEFPTDVGDAKEEDEMEAADEGDFAVEENGAETVDELNCTLTEYADSAIQLIFSAEVSCADEEVGVVATDDLLQSSATVKTRVTGSEANEEEDALEAVNEVGFAVEEKGVETVDEPHDTLSNDADSVIQLEEEAREAVNEYDFAVEEKGVETVDEPHDTQTNAAENVQEVGVVASEDLLQVPETTQDDFNSDICHAVEHNEMVNVERVSSEEEDISEENAFTGDLTLTFDGPGDHNTSVVQEGAQTLPLSTEMPNKVTAAEEMVSEAMGVSSDCMHGSSNKKRSTELAATEDGSKVKVVEKQEDPMKLAKLSLRTLRTKLKEKLTAKHKRKEAKRVALDRLDENVC